MVFGQGLAACELEQGVDKEEGGPGHRAGQPPAAASACGFPPPEGALAPREGKAAAPGGFGLRVGATARRSCPFTLGPASVPGASQGLSELGAATDLWENGDLWTGHLSDRLCRWDRVQAPERGRPGFPGFQRPHRVLPKGRLAVRGMDKATLVAVTEEGEEAASQGRGASGSWERPETALPGASGLGSPAPCLLGARRTMWDPRPQDWR